MEIEDYKATHVGNGKFEVEMPNGVIKEAGDNLLGIIRYTYFEDYSLPHVGWNVTRKQLYKVYLPKIEKDLLSGKITG